MFNKNDKKKLIIVYTKQTQKYASFLMQLIGSKDDREGRVIGVEDGSVDAVLWSEKDYEANRPTLSAASYILFVGDSKLIRQESAYMNNLFSQYGMKFSSMGKRAHMFIDDKLPNSEEYESFVKFSKEYGKTKVDWYSKNDKSSDIAAGVTGAAVGAAGAAVNAAVNTAGAVAAHTTLASSLVGGTWTASTLGAAGSLGALGAVSALSILGPVALTGAVTGATVVATKKIAGSIRQKSYIREDLYRFLALYSYMELLPKFLEG